MQEFEIINWVFERFPEILRFWHFYGIFLMFFQLFEMFLGVHELFSKFLAHLNLFLYKLRPEFKFFFRFILGRFFLWQFLDDFTFWKFGTSRFFVHFSPYWTGSFSFSVQFLKHSRSIWLFHVILTFSVLFSQCFLYRSIFYGSYSLRIRVFSPLWYKKLSKSSKYS